MKKKAHNFNADELVRSVEDVRDAVTGLRKITLRTTTLPRPAPSVGPREVKRLRTRLKMSQPVFAAVLNVPVVQPSAGKKGAASLLVQRFDCSKLPSSNPKCSLLPDLLLIVRGMSARVTCQRNRAKSSPFILFQPWLKSSSDHRRLTSDLRSLSPVVYPLARHSLLSRHAGVE